MQPWKKNVYLLWVAVLIASMCWSMVMPFMPVFLADELGVTSGVSAWAGVLVAVNYLGMAVMSPVWGAVGDRYGQKLMMLRAGAFLSVLYLIMSLVTGPYGLLFVRVGIGMLTGFIPTATSLVGTSTPQEHVGRALALVTTASPTGTILGPFLGGVLVDLIGMRLTMAASGVMVAIATLLVFLFVKEKFTPASRERGSMLTDMRVVLQERTFAVLMVTTMLAMASMAALDPIMVPFIKSLVGPDSPNWVAGLLYSLPGIAFVVATPWWTARAQTWGFVTTLGLGLGVGALLVLPQSLVGGGFELGGLRLAQGLATAAVSPGIAALIAQVVPLHLRGRAFGINQSAYSVGQALGPLLGGFVGSLAGPRWVFAVTAVVMAGGAAWTHLVVRPRVKAGSSRAA